ncbi:ABC transporter ATP-binding protein [Pelosinus sp. sgz500959]|uniref:ABC transporter ATP-binding protein n=1 Tax=Pelosinus sp. sgz500959 TaxID=3242472 RepID=UPI0036711B91
MTTAIEFENVSKKFQGAQEYAVDHLNLSIQHGELITILGSSGCGKTTLLKMVNRLYDPDSGHIRFYGDDISQMDQVQLRRKIGYVIQQVGLFPHMTIARNIAVVPSLLKWSPEKIGARVDELLTLVGLKPKEFKNRYPAQLSGGQQQRVGLARALAVNPDVMLLDEPFGAIDAITRNKLQDELLQIHKSASKTFLFVTHDIMEALKLGTKVLIMQDGKVMQFDTPTNIVAQPANEFVKSLLEAVKMQGYLWKEELA